MADLMKLFETMDRLSRETVAEASDSDDLYRAASDIDSEVDKFQKSGDYKDNVTVDADWDDNSTDFDTDLSAKFKDVDSNNDDDEKFNLLFDIEDFQDRGMSAAERAFDVARLRDLPLDTIRQIHSQVVADAAEDVSGADGLTDDTTVEIDEFAPVVGMAARTLAGMAAGAVADKMVGDDSQEESKEELDEIAPLVAMAGRAIAGAAAGQVAKSVIGEEDEDAANLDEGFDPADFTRLSGIVESLFGSDDSEDESDDDTTAAVVDCEVDETTSAGGVAGAASPLIQEDAIVLELRRLAGL